MNKDSKLASSDATYTFRVRPRGTSGPATRAIRVHGFDETDAYAEFLDGYGEEWVAVSRDALKSGRIVRVSEA